MGFIFLKPQRIMLLVRYAKQKGGIQTIRPVECNASIQEPLLQRPAGLALTIQNSNVRRLRLRFRHTALPTTGPSTARSSRRLWQHPGFSRRRKTVPPGVAAGVGS